MMTRPRILPMLSLLGCLAATVGKAAPALPDLPTQARMVIVMRHGVRSPSEPPAALSVFSAQPWPAWPVAPGELTPHGADALRLFASWVRQRYAAAGFWPAAGCPADGAVLLYADSKDHRTVDSGEAFLEGAFPGCRLHAEHRPQGETDPLFRAADAGICPVDQNAARASILQRLPGGLSSPWPGYHAGLEALARTLNGPSVPECATQPGRCFETGDNTLDPARKGLHLSGPLATGATLTEALNMEYLEGLPTASIGWGRLDESGLQQVVALHNVASVMMREDPVIAGHNGGLLARAVLAALSGQAAIPAQHKQAAQVTILVGHDTNLANLAGILGVTWRLPGEADDTPPGGALVFRLAPGAPGQPEKVEVSFVAQTALQVRELQKLEGGARPDEMLLAVPACSGTCTVARLAAAIDARVPASCRQP